MQVRFLPNIQPAAGFHPLLSWKLSSHPPTLGGPSFLGIPNQYNTAGRIIYSACCIVFTYQEWPRQTKDTWLACNHHPYIQECSIRFPPCWLRLTLDSSTTAALRASSCFEIIYKHSLFHEGPHMPSFGIRANGGHCGAPTEVSKGCVYHLFATSWPSGQKFAAKHKSSGHWR